MDLLFKGKALIDFLTSIYPQYQRMKGRSNTREAPRQFTCPYESTTKGFIRFKPNGMYFYEAHADWQRREGRCGTLKDNQGRTYCCGRCWKEGWDLEEEEEEERVVEERGRGKERRIQGNKGEKKRSIGN